MAGRRPKPTALKELAGNPGKRPLNKREPKPRKKQGMPVPRHLREEARREWRRLRPELEAAGLLTAVDADALALYCETYATWVEATAQAQKEGLIVYTDKGYPVQNPLLGIANQAARMLRAMLIEFGMTPASRSRVAVEGAGEVDPLDAFLAGAFEARRHSD